MSTYQSKFTGAEIDERLEEAEKISPHIEDKANPHETAKTHVGLGNADNTSDKDKPLSDAAVLALGDKVDKVDGKGLSANDYTDDDKFKLAGISKVARFVVGTSTTGWTAADCDYLCDGTADDVEINNAITALPATGGEILILDGTYNITAKINVTKDNVSIRGNGNATILKRMFSSSVKEGVITLTSRSGCKIADLQVDGNKTIYNNSNNHGIYLGSSSNNNTIAGNTCNNNTAGIYLNASSNNTVTGNTCTRGTGLPTDYTASQYTIQLAGIYNNYNLISNNNCMGKAPMVDGGTGNCVYGNKYDSGDYKDFTQDEKSKLAGIEAGAEVNPDIADDLETDDPAKVLSARQGKELKDIVSTNSSDIEKLKQSKVKIYGVKFTGSNPVGERIHDAVGMVADVGVDDQLVRNDFDSVDFYKRPRCNIYHDAQGGPIIMAYEGEPGFSLEGAIFPPYANIASVFYECKPCAWNGSFDEPQVTGTLMEGFELFECFPDWNTKIYLPSYWMAVVNGKPTSISGVLPGVYSLDTAMSTARTYHANGHVETMAAHMYEYILQLVEFATRDVQTVMMGASQNAYNGASDIITTVESETVFTTTEAVGVRFVVGQTISIGSAQNGTNRSSGVVIESIVTNEGVSTFTLEAPILAMAPGDFLSTRAWRNGATDIVVASSGSPTSNASGKYPCIWRGKVDPWAMAFSQICDLLIQRSGAGTTEDPYVYTPHYLPDPTKYAAGAITEDYTKLNLSLPIADGYAKSLGADKRFGFIGLTDMLGAASTTWLAAYYYYPRYEVCAVRVGGSWFYGRLCSPVSFNCHYQPSLSAVYYLARLSVRRN